MNTLRTDTTFAGPIPELYDSLLVPMIFSPYAIDLAERVVALNPSRVLETAAGTGVVTRAMAHALPAHVELVATDLNQPMLDRAAAVGIERPVRWRQADAMHLPFDDASFDVVVCQFGAMFFPDKADAYREARRVLKRNGVLLFNVWDRIEENEFAETISAALGKLYPADPPRFLERTPHGYCNTNAISKDLADAGFDATPSFDTVTARSRAASAQVAAVAYCQGTPLRTELENVAEATSACTAALAERFGQGAVDGKIQAYIVTAKRFS
ncbi:class I SAM-dependent methyltransferase [Caballeronia humi]|uniref:Methyltransferase type 11 n=1 Tax=Caballeronia humi TaxID=326474 RepID=A0A158GQ96_9BURK|nr:class I SAM-dependent methyltransferase [Caballeronia humi]SAL34275.1 methyltransferase type 11 [Caballeronia humi]